MIRRFMRFSVVWCCALRAAAFSAPQQAGADLETLLHHYPHRFASLWQALDLDRTDLLPVRNALMAGDTLLAFETLAGFYAAKPLPAGLQMPDPESQRTSEDSLRIQTAADAVLQDRFTFQGVTGRAERREDGGIRWDYNGPGGDQEWGWFLNRHFIFLELLAGYRLSGRDAYVTYFNDAVIDWILANPMPAEDLRTPPWRVMETGTRMLQTWPQMFYAFRSSAAFTTAARLLMLSSIAEQQAYILKHHERHHNHAVKEYNGLAHAAIAFPEFRDAGAWLQYALDGMTEEVCYQVYPDGVHRELAASYHDNVLRYWLQFVEIVRGGGAEPPAIFLERIEQMAAYLAFSMRPDGYSVQNNDSDHQQQKDWVARLAERFGREDWRFIASGGLRGVSPPGEPSVWYPWAGQLIMRSDWSPAAQWAYFDIGPWGTAHQHDDKLHLSLSAYGRDLLIDGGRYIYQKGPLRDYFVSSASHNLLLVDGRGQGPREKEWTMPSTDEVAIQEAGDFALSSFKWPQTAVEHLRAVVYVRGRYWVVVDCILSDRPQRVEALWHFAPGCGVRFKHARVFTDDPDMGNLAIVPAGAPAWQGRIVKGQTIPEVQGWWSRDYNLREACPVAIHEALAVGTAPFAWILVPSRGPLPRIKVQQLAAPPGTIRLRVQIGSLPADEIAVAMHERTEIPLSGHWSLTGRMARVREGRVVQVVGGQVKDQNGRLLAEHRFDPE